MKVIKPPTSFLGRIKNNLSVFLAGSIEMGKAEDWQAHVEKCLAEYDIIILNPRRDDWDSSCVQSIENPPFREQVEWELDAQQMCNVIIMNFVAGMKAPITLLELGLATGSWGKKPTLLVCCPPDFWRRGNVEIVCKRYHIPFFENLDDMLVELEKMIS